MCYELFFEDQHTNVIMFLHQLEVIVASIFLKCAGSEVERVPALDMFMFTVYNTDASCNQCILQKFLESPGMISL